MGRTTTTRHCTVCGTYMSPFAVADSHNWSEPVCRDCVESGLDDSLDTYLSGK